MKKITVTVEKEIVVEFDENSTDFQELWQNYKEYIDKSADYESFAENIASMIARYGIHDMIEGVGYVKHNGQNQKIYTRGKFEMQEGYVNVIVDTDINGQVDFDVRASED